MRVIAKDRVVYTFDRANAPICEVGDGETFWVETEDCYRGTICDETVRRSDIDPGVIDCSVGPIAIRSAQPGRTLEVKILDIELAPQGVMVTRPGLGVLGDLVREENTKIIPVRAGLAHFSEHIRLPVRPMIGVIGVAPAGEAVHCAIPGDHGANMDAKIIAIGSKVYLPIFQEGARLAVGDLHACMGDGELSGTGIEIGGRICMRTTVIGQTLCERPIVETEEEIYMLASDRTLEAAIPIAAGDMTRFLMRKKQLDFPDAYRLLSATCDIQICQVVNQLQTVRVRMPKKDLKIESVL